VVDEDASGVVDIKEGINVEPGYLFFTNDPPVYKTNDAGDIAITEDGVPKVWKGSYKQRLCDTENLDFSGTKTIIDSFDLYQYPIQTSNSFAILGNDGSDIVFDAGGWKTASSPYSSFSSFTMEVGSDLYGDQINYKAGKMWGVEIVTPGSEFNLHKIQVDGSIGKTWSILSGGTALRHLYCDGLYWYLGRGTDDTDILIYKYNESMDIWEYYDTVSFNLADIGGYIWRLTFNPVTLKWYILNSDSEVYELINEST